MNNPLYDFDIEHAVDGKTICGVDEAGRGPLCGPVCCAAVILDYNKFVPVNDSKKLSVKKRELLYNQIIDSALSYSIIMIDNQTIDEINILNATMLGMQNAIENLTLKPDLCLIDGNRCPEIGYECRSIVKGDANSAAIAAASILAKVSRDRYMTELDALYPQYRLAKHKGYGTALHYEMIKKHGIQDFYRKSFLKKILVND